MEIQDIYGPIRGGLVEVERQINDLAHSDLPTLTELLQHVLGQSGKKLRPALTLLVGTAQSSDLKPLIPMATAVELFHTATLVHDDTVDKSALRRGKPTVSTKWGGSTAVLFGDYLFAVSAELASTTGDLRVVRLFAQTLRTVSSGELRQNFLKLDLSQCRKRYYDNIACKTAALFVLATESAAILSGAPDRIVEACRDYGYNLGMAFQVVDDILDFVGAEADLGKPVGADLARGIVTLPVILAIERNPKDLRLVRMLALKNNSSVKGVIKMAADPALIAESYRIAREFCDKARACAEQLPQGPSRQSLVRLTDYVTERNR